ncbi:hypothetical protein [Bacillus sp. FJAT-26390]|uniref:hypothetical protein n=1 Tax=Bacillus sp. FJAT-26390 TaxID=1743142 RepID=UPI000808087A|nr:hypothetical protein [Bacillus sp. FJAT-26390]OBZ10877.1 hypothetical protein A7975_17900 [Bacillus sp. FJAT-26390]
MNKYLERYIENLTGRTFIKSVALEEEKVSIFFYKSYEEFLIHNKDSKITKVDYSEYFTQNTIEKILVGEPVRILREFSFVDVVSIIIPDMESPFSLYSIDINRKELNEYLEFKIEETSVYDGTWRSKFSDIYIHSKEHRRNFMSKFVSVIPRV